MSTELPRIRFFKKNPQQTSSAKVCNSLFRLEFLSCLYIQGGNGTKWKARGSVCSCGIKLPPGAGLYSSATWDQLREHTSVRVDGLARRSAFVHLTQCHCRLTANSVIPTEKVTIPRTANRFPTFYETACYYFSKKISFSPLFSYITPIHTFPYILRINSNIITPSTPTLCTLFLSLQKYCENYGNGRVLWRRTVRILQVQWPDESSFHSVH